MCDRELVFSPFYRATRMHSANYAVVRCLSVCLSLRPSVTRRYCV